MRNATTTRTFSHLFTYRERERFKQNTMSSRRKSRPPKRVHFELAEIAAQHIIREREQELLKRRREEQKSLMSVTSFNDAAVVAAVAKGWDAAAEVETKVDDLRKKAKVVKVRRLEGGGTAEGEAVSYTHLTLPTIYAV